MDPLPGVLSDKISASLIPVVMAEPALKVGARIFVNAFRHTVAVIVNMK